MRLADMHGMNGNLELERRRREAYWKNQDARHAGRKQPTGRQWRKATYVAGFAVLIILLFGLMSIASANTVDADVQIPGKTFAVITVKSGDTLWSIAESHMDRGYYTRQSFINEVILMNNLSGDRIFAGESLLVPILLEE